MSQRLRSLLVLLVGGTALVFAADVVVRTPGFLVPRDFLEYWAAGRVNLRGGNPYHPAELLQEQNHADPDRKEAVMMWNPPPTLAVYMPLGALPPRWAALLWVGLQLAAVFIACDLLWRTYCQSHRWVSAVVALSFAGTWWLVAYGQNTGFLLLGLAGFLHFTRKDRPLAAGACAALTALKPHLLACFGVLLLADVVVRRGGVALAAGAAVILCALAVALTANPAVVAQFMDAVRNPAKGARLKLTDQSLEALKKENVPAAVLAKLGAIFNKELERGEFESEVARILTPDEKEKFQTLILNHAEKGAEPLSGWALPVPAYWLRMWLAPARFWVQFVPCVLACLGFLAYRAWRGAAWDWVRELPLVVAVSVLTTPYGGWIFDLPVLLVPVVWAAARLISLERRELAVAFVVGQATITAASLALPTVLQRPIALPEYWWVAPAALALCLPVAFARPAFPDKPSSSSGPPP